MYASTFPNVEASAIWQTNRSPVTGIAGFQPAPYGVKATRGYFHICYNIPKRLLHCAVPKTRVGRKPCPGSCSTEFLGSIFAPGFASKLRLGHCVARPMLRGNNRWLRSAGSYLLGSILALVFAAWEAAIPGWVPITQPLGGSDTWLVHNDPATSCWRYLGLPPAITL